MSDRSYTPSADETSKLTLVKERYTLAHTNQYSYWSDFDRYYKLYESYVNEQKAIWETKIFIPLVFSVVERYVPRLVGNKPSVNYLPRNEMTVEKAQKMEALFSYQWDQIARLKDGGIYMELVRFVKDALITGTAIAKIPWVLEVRKQKMFNEKNEVVTKDIKYFDGPSFDVVDPYDFFFDPEATNIQQAQWVIHRTRKTIQEMKNINAAKGVEIYKNLDILEKQPADNLSQADNDFKYRRKVALGSGQVLIKDSTTDKHELLECWGWFPKLDANGNETQDLEERVVVVADNSVVVRDIPYPYWHGKKPFVVYTPFPRSHEFYGIPLIKHLERLQFYTNEFVSQKFDNQVIELNQMLVVDPQANLEDWQLVWRPGGVIRANPNYIKPLPLGDVTGGIDGSLQYLSQVTQLTTGLSDYYTGGVNAEQTLNKTATGSNNIEDQINSRIQAAVQVLEEQTIKEIGYQWHGLDGQFLKIPQIVRVIGNDGKSEFPLVQPEDIREIYDVIVQAGSMQQPNKTTQLNQFIQGIQIVGANQTMNMLTDWQAVEKELWQRLGMKQGDKLMTSTPGSNPQDVTQQGQQQPQQPGQMPSQSTVMGQAAKGLPMGSTGTQPTAGGEIKTTGRISTQFKDLTLQEQAQYLQSLGIQPDMQTRTEQFAQANERANLDRSLDLHDRLMPSHATEVNLGA